MSDYPELPPTSIFMRVRGSANPEHTGDLVTAPVWTANQLKAYVDADRAQRFSAQALPDALTLLNNMKGYREGYLAGAEGDTDPMWTGGETDDPVAEMDEIMAVYRESMGISPGPVMARAVRRTKAMLLTWWGWHRDTIRAALAPHPAPTLPDAFPVLRTGFITAEAGDKYLLKAQFQDVYDLQAAHRELMTALASQTRPDDES